MTEKRTSIFENGLIWFGAGVSLAEMAAPRKTPMKRPTAATRIVAAIIALIFIPTPP